MKYLDAISEADQAKAMALRITIATVLEEIEADGPSALMAVGAIMGSAFEACLRERRRFTIEEVSELAESFRAAVVEFAKHRIESDPTVH